MEIVLIAAVAENGVIGADGAIPWNLPADLARFKRLTTGHPVILGRRTHEQIVSRLGEPLPDRTSIVLTTTGVEPHDRVIQVDSIETALSAAEKCDSSTVFVAGGETVYEQTLDLADRLELTELTDTYEGNATFPDLDRSKWTVTSREDHEEFAFVTYVRKKATPGTGQ